MKPVHALVGLVVVSLGCGDSSPALAPVHGKVTLEGQPLAFKSVRFVPEPGTPGAGAGANTKADGSYILLAVRPGAISDVHGAPPGWYRVVVTEPMFPLEAPLPSAADGTPAPAVGLPDSRPRKKLAIPSAYTHAESTPLRVEVPHGGGEVALPLRAKP